ncbi:MAG: BREX-3 system phosphatase PglZ [Bacillota bacterium]|uniref:BREX-3 system phosphatase PglZ n=1 Tax=Desulforudis sp. DRI-14 TaxID=3459793 RepID=UPI00347DFEA8
MSSWRAHILREFTPKVARLTLVADPDGLLLEEGILEDIRKRGFELMPFEDHVAFRYAYESKFRSRWDRGEQTDLVVVLHSTASDLGTLPYDLLQAGRRLSFNLGDIFPNLSYPVVAALDRGYLDALYDAQRRYAPGQLGDNATKEFILRHVFEIAPELIKQPSDLLRVLLRRHYREQRIPAILDERFIQLLRLNDAFADWPLETIIPDREAFFAFLQERWPVFLDRMAAVNDPGAREDAMPYGFSYPGPADLPFDHHDIRVYIDNLFLEGMLQSVPHERAEILSKTWASIGVRIEPAEDRGCRLNRLIENILSSVPAEDARHGEWFRFARGWAELKVLVHDPEGTTLQEQVTQKVRDLQSQVDAAFTAWLVRRYAGLVNLPPAPPVMLHHIPRFMARYLGDEQNGKVALLLVDGLSLDQWIVVRNAVSKRRSSFLFRENSVFAWIPTVTSVSRQAAFAGKPPMYFPNTIQTTDKEPALWTQFWVDQGLLQNEVVYAKGLGDGNLDLVDELITRPKTRVVGLVIDKVDKIMHGMELGTAGMHNQVRQWARQSYITDLLDLLLDRGFRVFLTSDHGNIEAEGCGRASEGAVADLRGERVRVYADTLLRDKVQARFPSALKWQPIGLPEDYLALIAPGRMAFVRDGERIVSHGGVTIEELIVPFIEIKRRNI